MPLLLTRRDVEQVLTIEDAIAAVEAGFVQLARGAVTMPQRSAIKIPGEGGLHLTMPALVSGGEAAAEAAGAALAVKVVTVFPGNPSRFGLPTTIGTLLLNDPRSGQLLAIMDAGYLTAMRTGAASGVATRHLAPATARTVGIFGAGVQARAQLLAVCAVRSIAHILVCDPQQETRDRFAAEMAARLLIAVQPTEEASVCAASDIVITASSSKTPVFDGSRLRPGTHINCVGSHSPDARELDSETVRRSRIVCDQIAARLAEDGDFMLPIREGVVGESHFQLSLGEVVAGLQPGRRSPEEITLFKSGGLAVQDAVTAAKVYERARAAGVGTEVEI